MEIALTVPVAMEYADAQLIRQMAQGEEQALRLLYAKYGRRLFAYALRVTGDREVAEEVLQDSLLAAWRAARTFQGDSRVLTWLLGIVHRQGLNAVRRKRLPLDRLEEAAEVQDESAGPDRHAEEADRCRVLSAALDQLSVDHRTVLDLVFSQGLALADVAQVCGCPVGTVKSRLSYAKSYLGRALGKAGLKKEDLL